MCNRHNELDMSGALTAHFLLCNLYTAAVADNAFISDALIFTAGTLIVLCRTKDALAEKSVALRFICTIVYGLRFGNLAKRTFEDFFR